MINWDKLNADWDKLNADDAKLCIEIGIRAGRFFKGKDTTSVMMDVVACHISTPLLLQELLSANNFNFVLDVSGISNNLDRETGKLNNGFLPKYTKK